MSDPTLTHAAPAVASGPGRAWILSAIDPEATTDRRELHEYVSAWPEPASGESLEQLWDRAAVWSAEAADRLRLVRAGCADEVALRRSTLACAPLALLSGAWLQWFTSPAYADTDVAMAALALYAEDLGASQVRGDRGSIYRAALESLGLGDRVATWGRLAADPAIDDSAFDLAGVLVAMSRMPGRYRPEIAGADACLRAVGLLPPLAALDDVLPRGFVRAVIDPGAARASDRPTCAELSRRLTTAIVRDDPATAGRVERGFRWALATIEAWADRFATELEIAASPAAEMAELLVLRSRESRIYHADYELAGRPLQQWFAECPADPAALVSALGASRLVRPGQPERSPLITVLASEQGPMFRVFSPADLSVISRWITWLGRPPAMETGTGQSGAAACPVPAATVAASPVPSRARPAGASRSGPATIRAAYSALAHREGGPELRDYAVAYVTRWLGRASYRIDDVAAVPPPAWSAGMLRGWLAAQHDRHDAEYDKDADAPMPARERLIDSTVQLAPLTLIDGAWLQGFTDYTHASTDVGHLLFATYWDELGNGELSLNHPLIYREVLAEMDVVLPPTATPEFVAWPGFRDESFELPVFWLSIGRLPQTFLPEILGLNLAMELSGVGGSYRRARQALRAYGYSSRFVDIHNTIDNVATGHSAWAADAIEAYLTQVPALFGAAAVDDVWQRIRIGFRALNPPDSWAARRHAASRRTTTTVKR